MQQSETERDDTQVSGRINSKVVRYVDRWIIV